MPTAANMKRSARVSNFALRSAHSAHLAGSSAVSLNAPLSSLTAGMHSPDTSYFQLQQQQMMFYQQQLPQQQQQQMGVIQQQQMGFYQSQLHDQYHMGMALPTSKGQCMDRSIQQPYKQYTLRTLEQECAYCMYQNLAPSPFHNMVLGSFCSVLTTKLRNYLLRHFIIVH